jgi:hypothetical protein
MIHNIPQPDFEELVARNLERNPLNEIRKNHSFVRLEEVASDSFVSKFTLVPDRDNRLMTTS